MRKNVLFTALLAAFAWYGWHWVQDNVEVVTLYVRAGGNHDHYTRVFIVDDPPDAWIRAERRDRLWLASLRANPDVVVRRGGRDLAYTAVPWENGRRHERSENLFRQKYGVFDAASGFFWRRDAVPIRLERAGG